MKLRMSPCESVCLTGCGTVSDWVCHRVWLGVAQCPYRSLTVRLWQNWENRWISWYFDEFHDISPFPALRNVRPSTRRCTTWYHKGRTTHYPGTTPTTHYPYTHPCTHRRRLECSHWPLTMSDFHKMVTNGCFNKYLSAYKRQDQTCTVSVSKRQNRQTHGPNRSKSDGFDKTDKTRVCHKTAVTVPPLCHTRYHHCVTPATTTVSHCTHHCATLYPPLCHPVTKPEPSKSPKITVLLDFPCFIDQTVGQIGLILTVLTKVGGFDTEKWWFWQFQTRKSGDFDSFESVDICTWHLDDVFWQFWPFCEPLKPPKTTVFSDFPCFPVKTVGQSAWHLTFLTFLTVLTLSRDFGLVNRYFISKNLQNEEIGGLLAESVKTTKTVF